MTRRAAVGCCGLLMAGISQWSIAEIAEDGGHWTTTRGVRALVLWVVGLGLVTWAVPAPGAAHRVVAVPTRRSPTRLLLGTGIALIAVGVQLTGGTRSPRWLAVALWLVAMAALALAAGVPRLPRLGPTRLSAHGWGFTAVLLTAGVVRLTALGSHPRIVDGDGAALALQAREVAAGRLTDPFTTGYLGHPTLFAFVQRAGMALAGDTITGARLVSALAGTATVVTTYLLARRLAGRSVALTAAGVLAVLPAHVHFSRLALNNVFDGLTLSTALWLAARAIDERRAIDAVAAGVVVGVGQYFYFSAPFVAALVGAFAVWRAVEAIRAGARRATNAGLLAWMLAGVIVAAVPLWLHYLDAPETFAARNDQVLLIGDGPAARAARADRDVVDVLLERGGDALLAPFGVPGNSTYHPTPPALGWPFVLPLAVGLAGATAGARRSNLGIVALVWWAAMVAVGLTVEPAMTRWVFALPVVAIAVALGLRVGWQLLAAVAWARPALRGAIAVAVAVAGVAWSLRTEFAAPLLRDHGDTNSLVASELAADLADEPAGTRVFVHFAPRMGARSHATVPLGAPQVVATDVIEPVARVADVPPIDARSVFVFLPERHAELELVQARHPGGTVASVSVGGFDLYTAYSVEP